MKNDFLGRPALARAAPWTAALASVAAAHAGDGLPAYAWNDDESRVVFNFRAKHELGLTDTATGETRFCPLPETSADAHLINVVGNAVLVRIGDGWRKCDFTTKTMSPATEDESRAAEASFAPERSSARPGTGEPEPVGFRNTTAGPVEIFWIKKADEAVSYAKLTPGKDIVLSTIGGHRWEVRDAAGASLGEWSVPLGGAFVTLSANAPVARPEAPRRSDADAWRATGPWLVSGDGSRLFASLDACETLDAGRVFANGDRIFVTVRKNAPVRRITYANVHPKFGDKPEPLTFDYPKPGDPLDRLRPVLFDTTTRREIPVAKDLFEDVREFKELGWAKDGSEFRIHLFYRDNRRMKVVGVSRDGSVRTILSEDAPTFLDYSQKGWFSTLAGGDRLLLMSERDGRNRLYLFDLKNGAELARFPKGDRIVRSVGDIDETSGTVELTVLALRAGENPYYANLVRCRLDGSGEPVVLTHGDGEHTPVVSPKRRFLMDTWSRVDMPPAMAVRRADTGSTVADIVPEGAKPVPAGALVPERFVAKGRDGVTDIWGIIFRPARLAPGAKAPVVEFIYAGPHTNSVPLKWGGGYAEVKKLVQEDGFVAVLIDGMGTNWRDRAFHDVCWKNLGDAGFPDRIAWMNAAAAKYPEMDLSRVGIWGGSAGGQNAADALIQHPEFYKAAIADCGCHDNRVDKLWWNEAWMGWPIDSAAMDASSNIVNAGKLQGSLLLVLGECDTNVDTACTYDFAAALRAAGKPFELHVEPVRGHFASFEPAAYARVREFFRKTLKP